MFYLFWITTLIICMALNALLSYKVNTIGGFYHLLLFLTGFIPLWNIIAMRSKNLVFDGLLYDTILLTSYSISMVIITKIHLNILHYMGMALIILGVIIFQFGGVK